MKAQILNIIYLTNYLLLGMVKPTTYMPLYSSDPEDDNTINTESNGNNNSLTNRINKMNNNNRNYLETTSMMTMGTTEGTFRGSNFVKIPNEDRSKYEKFVDGDDDDDNDNKINNNEGGQQLKICKTESEMNLISDERDSIGSASDLRYKKYFYFQFFSIKVFFYC